MSKGFDIPTTRGTSAFDTGERSWGSSCDACALRTSTSPCLRGGSSAAPSNEESGVPSRCAPRVRCAPSHWTPSPSGARHGDASPRSPDASTGSATRRGTPRPAAGLRDPPDTGFVEGSSEARHARVCTSEIRHGRIDRFDISARSACWITITTVHRRRRLARDAAQGPRPRMAGHPRHLFAEAPSCVTEVGIRPLQDVRDDSRTVVRRTTLRSRP